MKENDTSESMNAACGCDRWKNENLEDARRRKRKVCKGEAATEGTTGRSTELCSTCEKLRGREGTTTTINVTTS
jgi:hypothetical protein